ncbi:MAG TPA: hypothetical protein VER33_08190 [Polyangiaceae bacterium]|nr:hypothetical protein [Polyangiaceae bacterium]
MLLKKFALSAVVALLAAGCGGPLKYTVASSNAAPGADAEIVADVREDQKVTQLEVSAENLPPPARISEGSEAYAVWYRKDVNAQWTRIGNLEYDADDREGKLVGSVPELAFDVEITAEPQGDPASPSSHVVFSQRVAK